MWRKITLHPHLHHFPGSEAPEGSRAQGGINSLSDVITPVVPKTGRWLRLHRPRWLCPGKTQPSDRLKLIILSQRLVSVDLGLLGGCGDMNQGVLHCKKILLEWPPLENQTVRTLPARRSLHSAGGRCQKQDTKITKVCSLNWCLTVNELI